MIHLDSTQNVRGENTNARRYGTLYGFKIKDHLAATLVNTRLIFQCLDTWRLKSPLQL
jgi:hypothetical protein